MCQLSDVRDSDNGWGDIELPRALESESLTESETLRESETEAASACYEPKLS